MNSKSLNAKAPAKKDRPRSTDKLRNKGKRDGTPEKSGSPSNEMFGEEENLPPAAEKKNAIINEEILNLAIKHSDLSKIREPRPPSEEHRTHPSVNVIVRKSRSPSELNKPTPKLVTVARPAASDAPLKPLTSSGAAGPRYDNRGVILPHSILGSVENYIEEGTIAGELPAEVAQLQMSHALPTKLGAKYAKEAKKSEHPKMESVEESNALKNWQARMAERRRQQGYLSRLLGKSAEDLVMNQADAYRQTQEERYLIDRSMPSINYGKGYRVGSEFWKQHEPIGDDIGGLHVMPGQTEKGYPPPIEHVGVPRTILQEKGSQWARPRTGNRKPWHKTEYLHQRMNDLHPVMKDLDPHDPDLINLEIVGTAKRRKQTPDILDLEAELAKNSEPQCEAVDEQMLLDSQDNYEDPLSCYPDVHPEPVFGPSILFAGQPARWTGDSVQFKDQVGIEARITFEAYETRRTTSHLEVTNDGTTCIYYSWQKNPKNNPFDVVRSKVQRFYFDNNDGVILPGDTMKFPFVFKSPNAGVFTEQWAFHTHPVVYGGATLLVTLRGAALQVDKLKAARSEIERELANRQAVQIVTNVLYSLISGIQTPERAPSPVDAYITEEELFKQKNAHLKYHNETVNDLRDVYNSLFSVEEQEVPTWDLDISSLKQDILAMDEEDDRKQDFLHKLNLAVANLSFPTFSPVQERMYSVCYHLLSTAMDGMVDGCLKTRSVLGILDAQETEADEPKEEIVEPPAEVDQPQVTSRSGRMTSKNSRTTPKSRSSEPLPEIKTPAQTPSRASSRPESKQREGKKGANVKSGKDKKGAKKDEKQAPRTPAKDTSPKSGKMTPSTASTKRPSSKTGQRDDQPVSPLLETPSPTKTPSVDPVLLQKYKEKVYTQTYSVLSEFMDQVSDAFAEIEQESQETASLNSSRASSAT